MLAVVAAAAAAGGERSREALVVSRLFLEEKTSARSATEQCARAPHFA